MRLPVGKGVSFPVGSDEVSGQKVMRLPGENFPGGNRGSFTVGRE